MAVHFHPLKIKNIIKQTNDCVQIVFDVPESLQKDFAYEHGQSLTVRINLDGQEVRRSYSICSAIHEQQLSIAVKKVENGLFSTYALSSLKAGDFLDVMTPTGNFNTTLSKENSCNYVAFAAGSGITPIMSIIKTTLFKEPDSTFTLVYGNKHSNAIIFKEELQAIKDRFLERFRMFHILSREQTDSKLNNGRIDKEKCQSLSSVISYQHIDHFFICGPEEMIFTVTDFLQSLGINKSKIHFELFTTPLMSTVHKKLSATKIQTDNSKVTIKLDGRSFDFELDYDSNNILDAALAAGADLPFACKGGVCCTCKAKLISGSVDMDVNYGLEDDEVEAGFILTCQSHPRTREVFIDFDEK